MKKFRKVKGSSPTIIGLLIKAYLQLSRAMTKFGHAKKSEVRDDHLACFKEYVLRLQVFMYNPLRM